MIDLASRLRRCAAAAATDRPTCSLFVETHGSLWTEKVNQPRAPEKVSLARALAHTHTEILSFFLLALRCCNNLKHGALQNIHAPTFVFV
jgi:hypothetical protein